MQEPKQVKVSNAVRDRLPRYYRFLRELLENDILRISSSELSKLMNVTASQIRQDLNCFGGFGQQGYGYNVKKLHDSIADILGANEAYCAVIIGAGHLGYARAGASTFSNRGVILKALFDVDEYILSSPKSASLLPIASASLLPFGVSSSGRYVGSPCLM